MSVFLEIPSSEWLASNEHAFAVRDDHPVSPGHTLVVTRRVIADWFAASAAERDAVLRLVDLVKAMLDAEFAPDGYNVGFNAGLAAGQTVMHLHVHVIPRFRGDMDDPRGGVRHVIPSKGNYLRSASPLAIGGATDPFARHVLPLFDTATEIAIVAAFVQESGLRRIELPLHAALARGAHVRLLTGDYLDITQASALEMLLDWLKADGGTSDDEAYDLRPPAGCFEARVIETDTLRRAFHPKGWRFESPRYGVAFVGSSNLSRSALDTGVEWNLRVDRDRDAHAYSSVRDAFDELWTVARLLDTAWVDAYAARARRDARPIPVGEIEADDPAPAPEPHDVQREALEHIALRRAEGWKRALVVLATGLGKTWLAAFDYQQLANELGRPPRLLFVAHRREILRQAASTYRCLLRDGDAHARIGWFVGNDGDLSAGLVFASVAKLARAENIAKLRSEHFDYVVVDEVHHAAADSYRRILDALAPRFLLGLTATPDRADSADILGLFDDHIAYSADIGRGIGIDRLVPFHYFGVKDDIDYANIPWRNARFDPIVLAEAAQTEARMQTLWRAWEAHPGSRTLIFCCSIAHADFVRAWLRSRGVRASAVYAAEGSDDRDGALRALSAGELDAVCSVDVFNEGVDVPSIDRVVMLRPTESGVVFLQQLGRGLRAAEGKRAVAVVDFVGNHRVFLERLRTLLSLSGRDAASVRKLLEDAAVTELPNGCSVDLELEAKGMLSRLFRVSGADEVERAYRDLRVERGARPTAGELERLGYLPSRLRARHGSWFDFVRAEGDLGDDERAAQEDGGAFLRELETTEMTKCFKMITLEALLEAGQLRAGLPLAELSRRSHEILSRSPELFVDVAEGERVADIDADEDARHAWQAYWLRNPITAWTTARKGRRAWFQIQGDRFAPTFSIEPDHQVALTKLTREIVDYRVAQYRARQRRGDVSSEGFVCRVLSNQRDPILKLPAVARDAVPTGEMDVRVDGAVWQFRFAKEFCNVARPAGSQRNQLPDLLRRWFGPAAGQPGTAFDVRFRASPDGLRAEPLHAAVTALAARSGVVAYPDLRAAAGHATAATEDVRAEHVMLPIDNADPSLFAVRVAGTSMDGGGQPLRDGDWAVMKLARAAPPSTLENRVVLVQTEDPSFGHQYQIKRLRPDHAAGSTRFRLASDNPEGPTFAPTDAMTVIARLDRALHPEDLAPPVGTVATAATLAEAFGLDSLPPTSGRHGGHLFIFIDVKGVLIAPDRVRFPTDRRPGETAFVLARRADGAFLYLGVGRASDGDATSWRIPDADYATWRAWGEGREVSRQLARGFLGRAQVAVDALFALPEDERWIVRPNEHRARILGLSERGGLRIHGGDGGFAERTVSLVDLAWVIAADDEARENGGLLDEARVNQARYLEGTPKGSTRWIDTGWALAAWWRAKPLVRDPIGNTVAARKVRAADGRVLDATFRVEPVGDTLSVVFESRGGTKGTPQERNADYHAGLRVVLERLKDLGLRLTDALVESRDTAGVAPEQRRIELERRYPLAIEDPERLRRQLAAGQARVGRQPGAKGSGKMPTAKKKHTTKTHVAAAPTTHAPHATHGPHAPRAKALSARSAGSDLDLAEPELEAGRVVHPARLTPEEQVTATEALARIKPRATALRDDEVLPYRLAPAVSIVNVRRARVGLARFRAQMPAALPLIDLEQYDALEDTALALVAAANDADKVSSDGETMKNLETARGLRVRLLTVLHGLALSGHVPMKAYTDIAAGSGARDMANDCVDLPAAFRKYAAAIAGKHAVTDADLAASDAVGTWLLRNLGTKGARKQKRVPSTTIDLRNRVATLLTRDYDDASVIAHYFLREGYLEVAPPLRSRFIRRAASPSPAPVVPPPVPTQPGSPPAATPAAPSSAPPPPIATSALQDGKATSAT